MFNIFFTGTHIHTLNYLLKLCLRVNLEHSFPTLYLFYLQLKYWKGKKNIIVERIAIEYMHNQTLLQ